MYTIKINIAEDGSKYIDGDGVSSFPMSSLGMHTIKQAVKILTYIYTPKLELGSEIKNEIRFLKWKDGKVYLVFEGSQRFRDRNQFNLIGRVNQDFSYDAQCLFYKNNK